ncbi:MAG: photosystem II complex extrinsic protein PsbU [Phormidesmis sp. RL_2_1]|nr:photosystem II complex extrinsic protein PsbU [Phormidesmis sp. RL_2_1]
MKRVIKQTLSGFMAIGAAIGILMSSLLLGVALLGVQPVSAMALSDVSLKVATLPEITLLANAGGRELRNSVDDKLATEYGNKIDVNNTNIASFRKFRGLYPTIAGKVVANAPYDEIEDIFEIPGLSQIEKDRLKQNIDIFTISPPDPALVEGADRFNNGVYK